MIDKQKIVLFELQAHANAILDFGDALDSKLNLLVGAAGVTLGLFSALGAINQVWQWYWYVMASVALCYCISVIVVTREFLPIDYHFPLLANWDHLQTTYLVLEEEEMLDRIISQYLVIIDKNNALLERKTFAVRGGMVLLFTTILILIVLQFFAFC